MLESATDTLALLSKLALALGFVLVAACSTAQHKAQPGQDIPLLHFQKTPCLGICPSYEATIAANGKIRYIGYEHVPLQDTAYFELPQQELRALQQEIAQLHYTAFQDNYHTDWSDMPSTIVTFFEKGKEVKRVKHQEGGPQRLLHFNEQLHLRLMQLAEEEARKRLPIK